MTKTITAIVLALTLTGCAALLPYLVAAGQVIQWVTAIVDQVDATQQSYFQYQPSPGMQLSVEQAIAKTRSALIALNEAVAAAESSHDGDVEAAKKHVLKCYEELYRLLETSGLLAADGRLGVAPGTLQQLPTPGELGARLSQ